MRAYLEKSLFGQLLIHFGPVGDILCSVGVVERRQSLLEVGSGRWDGSDDGRLGTPTERVLKETSQLRLPTRPPKRRRKVINILIKVRVRGSNTQLTCRECAALVQRGKWWRDPKLAATGWCYRLLGRVVQQLQNGQYFHCRPNRPD